MDQEWSWTGSGFGPELDKNISHLTFFWLQLELKKCRVHLRTQRAIRALIQSQTVGAYKYFVLLSLKIQSSMLDA